MSPYADPEKKNASNKKYRADHPNAHGDWLHRRHLAREAKQAEREADRILIQNRQEERQRERQLRANTRRGQAS